MRRTCVLAVALVAVLTIAAACSQKANDQAIANEVKAKFFADPQLKAASLNVAVVNGEVTLAGEVPSEGARYQAYKLAQEAAGVNKVNDQMTVRVAEAAPAPEPEPPKPAPRPRRAVPVRETVSPDPLPAPVPAVAAPAAPVVSQPAPAPEPPRPVKVEIPAGSRIAVRMIDSIDSETNHTGEVFRGSLDDPIQVDGETIIPAGADVSVKLAEAKSAGRVSGRSELHLELVRLQYLGRTYPLQSSTYDQVGTSRGKRTAATVGGAAAVGAVIGAIAGGGKGAAIGAVTGAGAGTAVQVLTKGQQVRVPSETRLDFRLEAPFTVTVTPGQDGNRR